MGVENCIAIQFLYCREEGLRAGSCIAIQQIVLQGCVVGWEEKIVLQYTNYIMTEA